MKINFDKIYGEFYTDNIQMLCFTIKGVIDNTTFELVHAKQLNLKDVQNITKICANRKDSVIFGKDMKIGNVAKFITQNVTEEKIEVNNEIGNKQLHDSTVYFRNSGSSPGMQLVQPQDGITYYTSDDNNGSLK